MRQLTKLLMDAVANDGNKESACIDVSQVYAISLIGTFTDSASTGTLKFQVSNDIPVDTVAPPAFVPTNWADAAAGSIAATAGGSITVNVDKMNYRWARVTWTRTAGAGTFSVRTNSQGF